MAASERSRDSGVRAVVPSAVHGDSPVGADADELGRHGFAELIATQIALSRPSSGMVMSLTGPWGTGKSSVLRMVTESLQARDPSEHIIVINYNPWFFSGTDQLVSGFLLTLADQLPKSVGDEVAANVAQRLRRYGSAIGMLRSLPAFGGIFGAVSDIAGEGAERLDPRDVDLLDQREQVAEALRELNVHVVVIVDDVDRLQSDLEIRQVMQMVKLVGDLPGVTYLLAFDSRPVREALSTNGINGHEYLEKIVQVEHVLPAVSEERLHAMLDRELNRALQHLPQDRIDPNRWPAVYEQIVRPLVKTPRHVRRLANSLALAMTLAGEDIDLTDLVALTAVSTFLPGFHSALGHLYPDLVPGTMQAFSIFAGQGKEEAAARLKQAATDSGNEPVALAAYNLLFPHTGHVLDSGTYRSGTENDWKRLRRVAELESLYRYLTSLTPEEGMSAADTQRILASTLDEDAFATELKSRDCQQLAVVAVRLGVHAVDIAVDRVPAVVRQLNRRAREVCGAVAAPLGDPRRRIEGAIATLLEGIPAGRRQAELRTWFYEEIDLTSKLAVFEIGRWSDRQQKPLADEELLDEMLDAMIADLEAMSAAQARELPDIGRIMWLAADRLLPDQRDRLVAVFADDWLFARFLFIHTEPSFGDGPPPLAWAELKTTLGTDWLTNRVSELPPDIGPEDGLNEVVRSAKELAHLDAAQQKEESEPG